MRGVGEVDVLVVGLGPAGATAAREAARAGARVIALDRKAEAGLPVQCAEFVPSLIGQDVSELAASRRQPIDMMDTYVEVEAPDRMPAFRGEIISRAAFDKRLVAEAESAGVVCRFGAAVHNIDNDGRVMLGGGKTIAARVLIGADGPRSPVGRAIGQVNHECNESRQVAVPLLKAHKATDIFLSAGIPGGYGWLFPKGDAANLGLGVAPHWKHVLKPELERLHARMIAEGRVGSEVLAITGGLIPAGGLLEPAGHLGTCTVLLAGDAAGLTNPVTGAGINAAVISGRMAGRAAARMVAGETGAADDYAEEVAELFGPSLARALRHRERLLTVYRRDRIPSPAMLRDSWIAYPQYWAN